MTSLLRISVALSLAVLVAACGSGTLDNGGNEPHGGADGGGGGGGGGGGAEVCTNGADDDGDGQVDCADTQCFMDPGCAASCLDACFEGTSLCDAEGVRACELQSTGCYDFGAPTACGQGLVCSAGECVATCTDTCVEGAKACSGGSVVTCQTLSTGCTEWVSPAACAAGEVCNGGTCVQKGSCQNQCAEGATHCTATGQQQSCVKAMSGCTEWALPATCPQGQACPSTGSACTAVPCTPGATRCQGTVVETCDPGSNWIATQTCPQACLAGACTTQVTCTPGAVRCNQTAVEICNSSGTAWLYNQTCNVGCQGGVCTDPCATGEKRCNGDVPETCNAQGSGWTAGQPCTTACHQGECIQADLIIDGVSQTLEGEIVLQNSLIVRNGGQIVVGPSGQLSIQAKTVSVDGASSIVADGVGDETRGSAGTGSCTVYSHCHGGYLCCNGAYDAYTSVSMDAACASYGTQGCVSKTSAACYGTGSADLTAEGCAAVSAPRYDRDDDLSISEGSKLGSELGGGLVSIVAETITVDGILSANGVGHASGGGILLAADVIEGTKSIQASGGPSGGGQGRVKLLRGSTNAFTGTVVGQTADSVMPPLSLVSGTHPDPDRYYNDGLGDLVIAWSRPFPTVNGYYYDVTTSPNALPSPSAGTFLQGELLTVPAAQLQPGDNFFHIVSVDSAFNFGTVKNTFRARVNATPPSISSQSHTEKTWTTNNAAFLTWTNPQDDAHFTGYHYALDHYADTVPTSATGTFTTNKQLLLSNLADGIWVFHLVNKDTRGATTLAARHFTLYIGQEPAAANMSGSVVDAGGMPLEEATVTINRGLFSTTTAANGSYTFNNGLYEGTWEVTVTKDGYQPEVKTTTLVAGATNNVPFTLNP